MNDNIKLFLFFFSIILLLALLIIGIPKLHHEYICQKYCNESYAGKTSVWENIGYGSPYKYKCENMNVYVEPYDRCLDSDRWVYLCTTKKCVAR